MVTYDLRYSNIYILLLAILIYKTTMTVATTVTPPPKTFRELVQDQLGEYHSASSYYKIQILITLRSMFMNCTIQEGLEAIYDCNEEWMLKVLLGVGMRNPLWSAVAKRRGELMGV